MLLSVKCFLNRYDIIYAMEQYVKYGHLHETNHFVTFNAIDACTKFSYEEVIRTLETFLNIHGFEYESVSEGLNNETIVQLVRLFLQNPLFLYDNKRYQQIYSGAPSLLLTIPSVCIYVFYGQSSLLTHTTISSGNELVSSVPSLNTTIGTTVHLLDLELRHDEGQFLTKIYRDPMTDEYHTCQPSSLFTAAFKHVVQCCSNEKDFDGERRHLRLSHLFRDFSSNFIDKCVNDFYNELGIETETCFLYPMIPYQTLRQHVLDNYEQQQNEKQKSIRVPYPSDWDAQMAVNIKNDLLNILKDISSNKDVFIDIELKLVRRPQIPLTINDYLVDKRPPLRSLTLPDNEGQ